MYRGPVEDTTLDLSGLGAVESSLRRGAHEAAHRSPEGLLVDLQESLLGLASSARSDVDELLVRELLRAMEESELDLPRIPGLAQELMILDPETSPLCNHEIAEIIGRDQELVAQVMRVANAPSFSHGEVSSLESAISRLGLVSVRRIALGASLNRAIYRVPGYQKQSNRERRHAVRTATVASVLATRMGHPRMMGPAYLGGLFHDVGKVLILRNLSQLRTKTRGRVASPLLIRRLVRELHVPLGLYFAANRQLPAEIRAAIAYHHGPSLAPPGARTLAWIIAAADLVDEQPGGAHDLEALADEVGWPDDAPPFDETLRCARNLAVTEHVALTVS